MPALRTRDTHSRPLEVSTDVPQPPTLTIISPTPRTFTFPNSHNLSDSPYSTPSSSPFEPDLRSLALTTSTPPLTRTRTLSPDSISSASPAPCTPKRLKSLTGPSSSYSSAGASSSSPDALERRPKKGDEDYIKRPENAFILFRRKCCEDRLSELDSPSTPSENASHSGPTKKQRQADLSKTISQQWKSLPTEERQHWERLAKEKKKEHEALYPNYQYRPQRVRDKDGKVRNKKRQPRNQSASTTTTTSELSPISASTVASPATDNGDGSTFSFIIPPVPRQHGRSASAPTPPPLHCHAIQIPTLHHITTSPSCPTSPNLPPVLSPIPMISRRATEGNAYMDYEHLVPPAFLQGLDGFQLQSSDYLRFMFSPEPSSSSSTTPTENMISPSSTTIQSTTSTSQPVITPPHVHTTLLPSPNIISPASAISTCSTASSGPASPSHFLSQPGFNPHIHPNSHSGHFYHDMAMYAHHAHPHSQSHGHLPEYSEYSEYSHQYPIPVPVDPSTGVPLTLDFSSSDSYAKYPVPVPFVEHFQQPYGVVEYPEYADYAEVPDFQQPEGYTFSWDSENVFPSATSSSSSSSGMDGFDLDSIPPCVVGGVETTPTPTPASQQKQESTALVARSLQGVEGGLEVEGPMGMDGMDIEPMELDMEGNAIMSMGMMHNGMGYDEMMAGGY
ncbi:hypothetical protein D9758_015414 [Tetrapyrgos nigripes]|uniref:HMG box domain-containing protein n=1 Tax=Tetrapyrgos nigripes TaxID=182062 RepID=A0A8H5CL29_9AGAR|nr:hypothetical protein D9758_015414 [Tetrapyrgos nigripes]